MKKQKNKKIRINKMRLSFAIFVLLLVVIGLISIINHSRELNNEDYILKDFSKFAPPLNTKIISKDEIASTISSSLNTLNGTTFDEKEHTEELENITETTEFELSTSEYKLKLNLVTGEILSFNDLKNTRYKKTKKTKEQVQEISDEIIAKLNLPTQYTCVYIYPFDDELWGVTYQAQYGEHINATQQIKMYFSPEENKVSIFSAIGNTKLILGDNKQEKSLQETKKTAENLAKKNKTEVFRETIKIVEANYFWVDNSKTDNTNIYRLAYVFTCNNAEYTKIFIDATTGEVIGGEKAEHPEDVFLIPEPAKIEYYKNNEKKGEVAEDKGNYRSIYTELVSNIPETELPKYEYSLYLEPDSLEKDYKQKYDYILFTYKDIKNMKQTEFNEIMFPIPKDIFSNNVGMILLKDGVPSRSFGEIIITDEAIKMLEEM